MTLPQIIMLNHASSINGKRMEQRMKKREDEPAEDTLPNGKRLEEMDSKAWEAYYRDW